MRIRAELMLSYATNNLYYNINTNHCLKLSLLALQVSVRNIINVERLCSLVVYLSTDPEVRVRFPALPDFLRSSGSGTGSTQPREYN
jgi:hypothetical protein